jgi:eukaryotic-like serine/threonine-protein kinase
VSRYAVERTLGKGGMATVELAEDTELRRKVAVKRLAASVAEDDVLQKRFFREARVAAALSHPNLVAVYDAGEEDGLPYIVMEYVEGETLADLLARTGPMQPERAVEHLLQVCAGLERAHAAGLVHRDIKPANLLLDDDGTLKIADFGIAWAAETTRLTQHGTVLGSAPYLSPEQTAGKDATVAADLYSLGAVLYELLTGRPPLEASSLAELARFHREGVIVPVREVEPAVSERVEAVVMRCLAREPAFRPASAAQLASELAEAVEAPTKPFHTAATAPESHTNRRRQVAVVATVAGAAAAVIAAAVVIPRLDRGTDVSNQPQPLRVAPPAPGATPAAAAENLSDWLRAHGG